MPLHENNVKTGVARKLLLSGQRLNPKLVLRIVVHPYFERP